MIRDKQQGQKHEVRGYTLLRNVRVRGAFPPGTPCEGRKRPYGGFRAPMPHPPQRLRCSSAAGQRRARCTAFCR